MKAICDNCQTISEVEACKPLGEINHLVERLDIGGEVPAGECPDCGCFAYLIDDETAEKGVIVPREERLEAALKSAINYIGELQRHGCQAGPVAVPSDIRDGLLETVRRFAQGNA